MLIMKLTQRSLCCNYQNNKWKWFINNKYFTTILDVNEEADDIIIVSSDHTV